MSKERQRRRAIAEAERRQQKARKAKAAGPADKPAQQQVQKKVTPKDTKRAGVYRQRKYPPLPVGLKVVLALLWLAAAAAVLLFVPTWTARIGFLVIATMALPLIVVIVWNPTRRTRR
jgi:Flp pilus assembly protein TadB